MNHCMSGKSERIKTQIADKDHFSFAVVGNINNFSNIFHKQIIPALNQSDHDFVVSAGNAVSGGAEENYRSLLNMLADLQMPKGSDTEVSPQINE